MLNPEQIPSHISPLHRCTPSRLAGERRMITLLRRLAASRPIRTVLDVGCGSGEYRFLFPGCQYTGIDIVDHAFALKQEPGITLKVGDACCLPEESRSFDLVFSSYAFEYFPDPVKTLSEMKRVLNDHGVAMICLPTAAVRCYEAIPVLLRKTGAQIGAISAQPGIRHYSPAELRELGSQAGLDMVGDVPVYGWATLSFKFATIVYRVARHLISRQRTVGAEYPLYADRCVSGARNRDEWTKTLALESSRQRFANRLYVACVRMCMGLDHLTACRPIAEYIAVFRKSPTAVATS